MNQNLEARLAPLTYHVEIEGVTYKVGTENLRFDGQNHSPPQIKGRVYVDKIDDAPAKFSRFFKFKRTKEKRVFQSSLNLTSICKFNGFEYFYIPLIHLADKLPKEFKEKDIKYFESLFSKVYKHYKSLG